MSLSAVQIENRLEAIEAALGERQEPYAKAAEDKHKLARQYEERHARAFLAAAGTTATEKKARAVESIAGADDDLWERLAEAEGAYEGQKAAVKTLEIRATIGMSLLKGAVREPSVVPRQDPRMRTAA